LTHWRTPDKLWKKDHLKCFSVLKIKEIAN
jgi:hypothetical protein